MGFVSMLMVFAPLFLAGIGLVICLWLMIAVCLLLIGFSGLAMNKLYVSRAGNPKGMIGKFHCVSSILLGVGIVLVPLGAALAGMISLMLFRGGS